jgi:Spy/CpxP family protein refolding chaperone
MLSNFKRGLVIAIAALAVGGVVVPHLVSAQSTSPNSTPLTRKHQRGDLWKQLNLTDAQKQQFKTIHENTRQQIQSVFTDEQRAKLEAARQSGDRKGVMKSLNLTDAQKQQIRDIRKKSYEQMQALLTAEQRDKLQQLRSEQRGK